MDENGKQVVHHNFCLRVICVDNIGNWRHGDLNAAISILRPLSAELEKLERCAYLEPVLREREEHEAVANTPTKDGIDVDRKRPKFTMHDNVG